jgi:type IV secretion system protein VirD4
LSDACVDALMRFVSTEEKTLSNILSTLNAPLTIFADPLVDVATSANDFSLLDLRRKRMTVYVCVPPNRLADSRVLVNLFFGQLLSLNTNELPEHNPELKHQCLLVLDECTAFGRINILATAIGYMAGYNLRLITVIQAISQLESVYGKEDARTFVTNHALQILYAPREQKDANEYSEMLGTFTQREESKSRTRNHGARGGLSQGTNESSQKRALLMPQEFKELGSDHEVVMLENCKPILADKIRYYTDPVFMARLMPPPILPQQDLALHKARLERRTRPVTERDDFALDQIAVDFQGLPRLTDDATEDHLKTFSASFFNLIAALDATEDHPTVTTLEPALAA